MLLRQQLSEAQATVGRLDQAIWALEPGLQQNERSCTIVFLTFSQIGSYALVFPFSIGVAGSPCRCTKGACFRWNGSVFRCRKNGHQRFGVLEMNRLLEAIALRIPSGRWFTGHLRGVRLHPRKGRDGHHVPKRNRPIRTFDRDMTTPFMNEIICAVCFQQLAYEKSTYRPWFFHNQTCSSTEKSSCPAANFDSIAMACASSGTLK